MTACRPGGSSAQGKLPDDLDSPVPTRAGRGCHVMRCPASLPPYPWRRISGDASRATGDAKARQVTAGHRMPASDTPWGLVSRPFLEAGRVSIQASVGLQDGGGRTDPSLGKGGGSRPLLAACDWLRARRWRLRRPSLRPTRKGSTRRPAPPATESPLLRRLSSSPLLGSRLRRDLASCLLFRLLFFINRVPALPSRPDLRRRSDILIHSPPFLPPPRGDIPPDPLCRTRTKRSR